ncbi:hypothetical protein H6G97_11280 [Nostoc flagelliforme FACHB-838]|uniref:JmjC domain-containing protein n=1 Tax=Nostoc flagelliforme FACHB-838 TaxID=2692904 RepID=A0ABR8DMI9_9NOSO|nr:cupin domain-containing protein [Nostoc flagelliforme]MBD2530120.1 hypothetical protein [Nostoc flagelliforme FACHB-838]
MNDFNRLLQPKELATSFEEVQEPSTKDFDIDRLLQPMEQSTFFSEYWEQRPLILSRRKANYYSSLFSMQDVDSVIYFTKPTNTHIRLLNNGQLKPNNYVNRNGILNINQLYDGYHQGNTIILEGLHERWKSISIFSRHLESFFNHPVNVNMYLTPRNSQGFSPHFDTHDVFILQVEGKKHWRIYDSFLCLPSPMMDESQQFIPQDKLSNPLYEVVLNAGELLYIPRGYVHEALTSDCSSLHLTVGIATFSWADLISNALRSVNEQNVCFRKSLPIGFLNYDEMIESLKHQFKELLELLSNTAIEDAVNRLAKKFFRQMPPLPDGHFTQIDDLSQIDLDTIVEKRKGMICRIIREEGSISIQFPGNQVRGPNYIEPALRFIAASGAFPVRAISETLSDNGKLVLVRRLLKEGLLTRAQEKTLYST